MIIAGILLLNIYATGQSRTTNFSLPLWNAGDVLRAGSTTDTSTGNSGINSLSLRTEKHLTRWFDKTKDSLRNVSYIRFNNGIHLDASPSNNGVYFYNGYLYMVPSTPIGQIFYPYGVGAGNTSALVFNELLANGINYVGLKAPDNIPSNHIWTLPDADGSSGQFLKTNGSGILQWGTPAGVTSLNGLTGATQTFSTGNSGTDFTITSSGTNHTFSIPTVGLTRRGLVSSGTDTLGGTKYVETIVPRSDLTYDLGNSANVWNTVNANRIVSGRTNLKGYVDVWDTTYKATIQTANLSANTTFILPNTDPFTTTPVLATTNSSQDFPNVGSITSSSTFTMNSSQSGSTGIRLNRTVATKSLWEIYLLQSTKNLVFRDSAGSSIFTLNYGGGATLTGPLTLSSPLSSTYGGIGVNSSAWTGFAKVSSGTWSAIALVDTITKAGSFYSVTAKDSFIVWEARESNISLTEIRAMRIGGTADTINCTRTRAGATVDLLSSNFATSTSMNSAGTVQNTSMSPGDILKICLRGANASSAQEVYVQLMFTKSR